MLEFSLIVFLHFTANTKILTENSFFFFVYNRITFLRPSNTRERHEWALHCIISLKGYNFVFFLCTSTLFNKTYEFSWHIHLMAPHKVQIFLYFQRWHFLMSLKLYVHYTGEENIQEIFSKSSFFFFATLLTSKSAWWWMLLSSFFLYFTINRIKSH